MMMPCHKGPHHHRAYAYVDFTVS